MNAEHLLDAMGLLDDDLIQEAERYHRRKSRSKYGRWLAWAASFAVVIVLGYGATHFGMGGGNSGAPGNAASGVAAGSNYQQAPMATDSNGGTEPPGTAVSDELEAPSASVADPNANPSEVHIGVILSVTDSGKRYTYRCDFNDFDQEWEPQLDALPDNCRSLGEVAESGTEGSLPHTDVGWYAGCALWIQGEGWEGPVYLELPEGGYLVFEYSQTYDLPN